MSQYHHLYTQFKRPTLLLLTSILFTCSPEKEKSIDYFGQKPPGLNAELFAPGLISTDSFEHSAPAFSPDGSVVLWTVVDRSYRAVMLEMKYEQGKWSAPHRPSFADSTADDYYPSFSADGKKLYFGSRRKVPVGYPGGGDMRIWEVERNHEGWGDPIPVDSTVSQGHEYAHSITANGTLYFTSSLGGATNWCLRKSEKVNGIYTKPVLLPYNINSVDYEDGPYVAPDESFLIFESQRPEGVGGSGDLYISFSNKDGLWTIPVNMGPKINSASTERFARLSPDGKYLFFGSSRNQSKVNRGFDIYWIDARVLEELRNDESSQEFIEMPMGQDIINALYKNDNEASAGLMNQWIGAHRNSLDAAVVYSAVLRRQKEYSKAEQHLANSQGKEDVSIIMEMALVKFGLNKEHEAVKLLAPILVEGSQLQDRYFYLSKSLLDMEKFDTSDEYFEKGMAIAPNSFFYFKRARVYAQIGEEVRAFVVLNKSADLGFNSRNDYEDDPELESLKSDSRWTVLLKKLK